ncbi:unnamed protein product [Xylocopa violacea]|uniref:MADF domain-containing protein n=1 Tax=Xylocopa violacea TaxID=135666 RepID=A0ABP1NXU9_XYLVO
MILSESRCVIDFQEFVRSRPRFPDLSRVRCCEPAHPLRVSIYRVSAYRTIVISADRQSKEQTLELIAQYRKRSLLWDPKSPNRYNKIRKEEAWQEIAQKMKRSVDECKKKMEYLLTALRREKMKIRRSIRKGVGEVYESSWFAFEPMRFIWDKNNCRRTLNTVAGVIKEEVDMPTEVPNEEVNSGLARLQDKSSDPSSSNAQCSQQLLPKKKLKTQILFGPKDSSINSSELAQHPRHRPSRTGFAF